MDVVNHLPRARDRERITWSTMSPKQPRRAALYPPDVVYNAYGSADSSAHSSAVCNNYGSAACNICDPLLISDKSNNPLSPTTPTEAAKPTAAEQPVVVVDDDHTKQLSRSPASNVATSRPVPRCWLNRSDRSIDVREEREHCWQVACAAVLLEGLHQVRQFVRSAKTHARDEADYYRGTIRRFAEERGHKWHELRKQLPACPQLATREAMP